MEGCSKYCSFCVVPYTRGEEVSRPVRGRAGRSRAARRAGRARGQPARPERQRLSRADAATATIADLGLLIRAIAQIDGIGRIRFTTSHPLEFSDSLIEAYRDVPQLANYLHLPVQSGSDRILAAMKRGYTALEFKQKIRKLRAVRPDISISSDFIVGFPGETDADFEKTMKLIEDVGFDQSFSFIYSRRPGTPAADLADDTPGRGQARAPANGCRRTINAHAATISQAMVGSVQRVLVEGPSRKDAERTDRQDREHALGEFRRPPRLVGQFVDVVITEAMTNSLRGGARSAPRSGLQPRAPRRLGAAPTS